MKNKFPKGEEWNRIVDEAFSSDSYHTFSENYKTKKAEMRKGITMKKTERKTGRAFALTTSAVAAALVIFPASVYAYTKQQGASIEQTAPYANTVTIDNSTQADEPEGEETAIDDTIYDIEFGWLPEGLAYQEDGPYGGKFHNYENDTGMTPCFYKIPEGIVLQETLKFSADLEEYNIDGKTVMINYRVSYDENAAEPTNFGREIWISFDNTPYVLQLFMQDGISKEDTAAIIENIHLVPTDTEVAATYQRVNEPVYTNVSNNGVPEYITPLGREDLNLCHIGDTISEPYPEAWGNVSVTINSVHWQYDFSGITTDSIGRDADYSEYIDESGYYMDNNTRTWYKLGDGVNTLDEDIYSEPLYQHILVVNLTYTNNDSETIDYCICPDLFTIIDGIGTCPTNMYPTLMVEDADSFRDDYCLNYDGMAFSFSSDKHEGKNHILVAPGESAEVQLAFMVDDDLFGNLYMNVNATGSPLKDATAIGAYMLDLCDIIDVEE